VKKIDFTFLLGLVPLFMVAHFSHHVLAALISPLLPYVRSDLDLNYTQSGLLVSAFTVSYGFSHLPAGWIADRVDPRIIILISICGVALAGFFIGLSHTYFMMVVFFIMMGTLGGGYHPSATPLISAAVDSNKRGFALGLHIIGGSASFFLTPLIGVAIATYWGWRNAFKILSIPTIIVGIILFIILGRYAQEMKRENRVPRGDQSGAPVKQVLSATVILFLFLSTFTQAIIVSTIVFIPLYMVDHFGAGKESAAISLAIIHSTGFWAGPLGGYLADRFGTLRLMLSLCFIIGPTIYLINMATYGPGFYILLIIIGMVMKMRQPVSESYLVGQAPAAYRSTLLGIYFFAGIEGGGVLTPLVGYLIDTLGFQMTFSISGGSVLITTIICSFFLKDKKTVHNKAV